jgi:hypothetical protein
MGFTKLDEGIVFSSIMGEDDSVFKVWAVFMATCKENGISPISPVFISSVTKKTIDEVMRCIGILESPDPISRSIAEDGRRIRRVDGGYFLINYKKYREFTYSSSPKALKQRRYRERLKNVTDSNALPYKVTDGNISASASESASVKGEEGMGEEENKNSTYLPLSELLRDKIKQSGTDAIFKETDLIKWNNHFRLMVEQDGRTVDQIKAKITAVFEDQFWSKQIRSAGTLREKWKLGRLDRLSGAIGIDNSETDAQGVEKEPEPTDPWKRFLGTSTMNPSTKAENYLIKIWERTFGNQDYKTEPWYGGAWTEDQYKKAWEVLSVVKDKKQAAKTFDKIHRLFEVNDDY